MFDLDLSNVKAFNQKEYIMNKSKQYREGVNYNAFYMAIVIDTNDELELGRVKIRIPAIHGIKSYQSYYTPDEGLPWARPGVFNAAGNDMGQFIVPQKGNRVFVTFEADSPSNPIYFGGIPTIIGNTPKIYNDNPDIYSGMPIEITDDDKIKDKHADKSNQVVYKSFKGATIEINDKDGQETIRIIDASGQIFEMGVLDPDGTPLPRRGDKEGSDNIYRFIRLGNQNEFIEIIDGKIHIAGEKVEIDGYEPGGAGANEVEISDIEPTDQEVEIWVDTDDDEPAIPTEIVTDPDYVHTDNNFTDALKKKLEDLDLSDIGKINIIKRNGVILENDDNVVKDPNYVHTDNNFDNTSKNQINDNKNAIETNINDISEINYNISNINQRVTNNSTAITTLGESTTENTNNIELLQNNKLDKNFTSTVMTSASFSRMSGDYSNNVLFIYYTINPQNNSSAQHNVTMPLASDTAGGIMPKESFSQINQNTEDIIRLKQMGGRFIGISFNTYAELEAYEIPDSVNVNDFTFVREDETHDNAISRYIVVLENGVKKFQFAYIINESTYGNFSQEKSGLILGADEDGKVFAENDGTGSVVGWDSLKSRMTQAETDIISLDDSLSNNYMTSTEINNKLKPKLEQSNLIAGNNVTLTKDTETGNVTINAKDTTQVINSLDSSSTTAALSAAQGKALNDKVEQAIKLNDSNLKMLLSNVTYFTPENGQSWDNWGGCFYYKIGTRVVIHIGVKLNTSTRVKIVTLPQGFRPGGTIPAWGGGADGAVPDNSFAEIYNSGDIWVKSSTTFALMVVEFDAFA